MGREYFKKRGLEIYTTGAPNRVYYNGRTERFERQLTKTVSTGVQIRPWFVSYFPEIVQNAVLSQSENVLDSLIKRESVEYAEDIRTSIAILEKAGLERFGFDRIAISRFVKAVFAGRALKSLDNISEVESPYRVRKNN